MTEELLVDRRDDGIVLLTLNDPARRNAMAGEMTEAWRATIAALRTDGWHSRRDGHTRAG